MTANQRLARIVGEGKCIGCGLCASLLPDKLSMQVAPSGYLRPAPRQALDDAEADAIEAVCPGVVQVGMPPNLVGPDTPVDEVWGPHLRIDRAHAAAPAIRHLAATGGALTALAQFLVDSGQVRAVLHVRPGGLRPSFGHAQISTDGAAVAAASGSRYGPAAPLAKLHAMLNRGEKFAIVAKPCDISAVRQLGRAEPRVRELVTHCLTMVCGGIMPPFGMDAFLKRVGVPPEAVAAVSYRGNGCPGPTRVELKNGEAIERTYLEFWGTDASMWHLAWRCKVCPDGTGEGADIAAGDTWPGGSPTEEMLDNDAGTNFVIARTDVGATLVRDAAAAGYLNLAGPAGIGDLNDWQPHQVRKKIACEARFDGMAAKGQLRIKTVGLRTKTLRARMDPPTDAAQVTGASTRIALGKHKDGFCPERLD